MNSRNLLISFFFIGVFAGISGGCGVKGKPLPPLEAAHIGRGAPTYKRTAEQARPATVPSPTPALNSPPNSQPDGRGR